MSAGLTRVAALDIAESAADVPTDPGVTRLRRSGGVLQAAAAGGAWSALAAVPAAAVLARAQALIPNTTLDFIAGTDFDNDQWYRSASSGGTITPSVVDRGGVLLFSTTATLGRNAIMLPHGTINLIDNPKTSPWYMRARVKFTSAVDAQAEMYIGITPQGLGAGATVAFGVRGSVSTGFFSAGFTDNAGTFQFSATTTVAYDTTAYHVLEIYNDLTTMHFLFDGVEVASSAVTAFGTTACAPFAIDKNGTTAADRTMSMDDIWFACAKQT